MTAPLSRRRFAGLSLAASTTLFLPGKSRAATPAAEILETRVISPQAGYYHGWPTLTRTQKGGLVLVWSGRREAHVCPFVAQIRNHNAANKGETLQAESTDGGKTWSEPHSIGVRGLPSHLLRLRDDRLLMTYGHRREPFGNRARISADEGATWSEPLVISGDGIGGDLGYPSTVELEDGSFVSVWYEKLAVSPMAQLRQARWRLN